MTHYAYERDPDTNHYSVVYTLDDEDAEAHGYTPEGILEVSFPIPSYLVDTLTVVNGTHSVIHHLFSKYIDIKRLAMIDCDSVEDVLCTSVPQSVTHLAILDTPQSMDYIGLRSYPFTSYGKTVSLARRCINLKHLLVDGLNGTYMLCDIDRRDNEAKMQEIENTYSHTVRRILQTFTLDSLIIVNSLSRVDGVRGARTYSTDTTVKYINCPFQHTVSTTPADAGFDFIGEIESIFPNRPPFYTHEPDWDMIGR